MNWLSLVSVDKRECRVFDSYGWHKQIWLAFPGQDNKRPGLFLFRVDDLRQEWRVYVLSAVEPKPPEWGIWQKPKEVAETFLKHDRYRFQLKANPTMRRKEDGRRLGLFKEDLLRAWMKRKGEVHGFAADESTLMVGAPMEERFRHDGVVGKHIAVDFQGVLKVTNREAFKKAFENGIGSAKAFGFGLLMLRSV